MKWFFSILAAGVAVVSPLRADLVTLSTAVGNGADAYVRGGQFADTNFGYEKFITSRSGRNDASIFKDYFRFDLSGLTLDFPNDYVPSLDLVTHNGFKDVDFKLYVLNDAGPGDAAEGWLEGGITYNNAPGNDTKSNGVITDLSARNYMTLVGEYNLSAKQGETVSFSLNNSIFKEDTNGLITFALVRGVETDTIHFNSKDGDVAKAPSLTVSAMSVAVPEPQEVIAAIALLVAIIGMAARNLRASKSIKIA